MGPESLSGFSSFLVCKFENLGPFGFFGVYGLSSGCGCVVASFGSAYVEHSPRFELRDWGDDTLSQTLLVLVHEQLPIYFYSIIR
jgi:hypothetical protein